jgi:capsular exopolysaccharide synthesis family protein
MNMLGPGEEELGLGLGEILSVISRRRNVLLWIIGPALVLATVALMIVTPRYSAETMILIETPQQSVATFDSVISGLSGDAESVKSESYVLTSRALADRVIQKLALDQDPEFNSALDPDTGKRKPDAIAPDLEYTGVVDAFLKRLSVLPQDKSRVITVSFSSESPQKAALGANALVEEYILARLEAKYEGTQRASGWLSERVNELREKVEVAEQRVEEARREFGLLEGQGYTLTAQELGELNSQLIIAKTDRAEAEVELQLVDRLLATSGGAATANDVLDSTLIQRLREQQSEVQRRVAELSSEYGDKHPKMIQLRAEAENLELRIEEEVRKIVAGLRNKASSAQARERAVEERLRSLKNRAADSNQNEIQLRALEREADAGRSLLTTMLARQKETISQEDIDFQQPDARIISPADTPIEPSFPQTGITLGLVFLAATIIGMMVILILELLDGGFRSSEQLERVTGIPSLGFIPKAGLPKEFDSLPSYVASHPNTAFAESIRTLNWTLGLAYSEGRPQRILVSSAVPEEGKTTIATCLASVQSSAGERVLLIDADTRRPSCNGLLNLNRDPGLTDVLMGNAQLDDALQTCEWSGLTLLPAGRPTPNISNLLASSKLEALLDVLDREYDLIVIDSPPILAAADARILAKHAHAAFVVVRWAKTRRQTVRLAVQQLDATGVPIAGTLLSAVDARKHAQYGYGDSGVYAGNLEKYYAG